MQFRFLPREIPIRRIIEKKNLISTIFYSDQLKSVEEERKEEKTNERTVC